MREYRGLLLIIILIIAGVILFNRPLTTNLTNTDNYGIKIVSTPFIIETAGYKKTVFEIEPAAEPVANKIELERWQIIYDPENKNVIITDLANIKTIANFVINKRTKVILEEQDNSIRAVVEAIQ